MEEKAIESKLYYGFCLFLLFFVTAAASFSGFYQKWHFRELESNGLGLTKCEFSLDHMVDGTAPRPFVYRQLLPMLANWVDSQVPRQVTDRLFEVKARRSGIPLREFIFNSPLVRDRTYFLRYIIIYFLVFLSALISAYAMYLLLRSMDYSPAVAAFCAVILLLIMPFVLSVGGYLYDFPELAFLALAVWMAFNFDWWWMIPLVALATLNKESFLFFIPTLYPFLRRRGSRFNALTGTAVLGSTCAVVYGVLRADFQHNPGETAQIHMGEQIQFILHPSQWFLPVEPTYGLPLIRSCNPLLIALILWTVWRGWRCLPKVIQQHIQIATIINFSLYFVLCAPGELRDFSFLYVSFLLLLATNLTPWFGGQSNVGTQPAT